MTEVTITCDNCGAEGLIFLDPEGGSYHRCCMNRAIAKRVCETLPIEQRDNFVNGWKEDMRVMHYAR